MTRLNAKKAPPSSPPGVMQAQPWVCSGALTASAVISNHPGVLGAVLVEIDDTGQDSNVALWDSATATVTSKECLGVFAANDVAKLHSNLYLLPLPGVEFTEGLYLVVTAGDVKVFAYYR